MSQYTPTAKPTSDGWHGWGTYKKTHPIRITGSSEHFVFGHYTNSPKEIAWAKVVKVNMKKLNDRADAIKIDRKLYD